MTQLLLVLCIACAVIAAVIHLLIFLVESVLWNRPAVWKRFGVRSQSDADVVRPMAYNQGFYNLFLAVGAALGVGMMIWSFVALGGVWQGGIVITLFALSCMVLASIVLLSTNRRFWQAAIVQGAAPLLGILSAVLLCVSPQPLTAFGG